MKNQVKIGLIIADPAEYAPVEARMIALGGNNITALGNKGMTLDVNEEGKNLTLTVILCGIGKVNAAAATGYLAANDYSYILSAGFSGGLHEKASEYDAVVGTKYIEHDFDLTVLGYKPAEKPGEEYIHPCSRVLYDAYLEYNPNTLSGTMVAGDCFICSDEKRDFFINTFSAVACDMETAAEAAVCNKSGVGYLAIRKVSDGAGDGAENDYRDSNSSPKANWFALIVDFIVALKNNQKIWSE